MQHILVLYSSCCFSSPEGAIRKVSKILTSVITPLQSGFVSGDSTVNQLVDIYNTFSKAMDDGLEVKAIFCDISKAFDRV